MSDEEEEVPRPGAPIMEEPYPYELLDPETGEAPDIREFLYGGAFRWNIERVSDKRARYMEEEGIYTFDFNVVWMETWHSRRMIRQFKEVEGLEYRPQWRVCRRTGAFPEYLVTWRNTREYFVNFSDHYKLLVEQEHG